MYSGALINCKFILSLFLVCIVSGCASGLNSIQKAEYSSFESSGVLIEEKDPKLAIALGILPGVGSFYVEEVGPGIINLLLWPVSILWDPFSGYEGAISINYQVTKWTINKKKEKELSALADKLALDEIDIKSYIIAKNEVIQKYDYTQLP